MNIRLSILAGELHDDLVRAGLRTYEDFVDSARGRSVSNRGSAATRSLTIETSGGPMELFIKVYRRSRSFIGAFFMRDRCMIEARNYAYLRDQCGANVPQVVAHGCRRGFGVFRDGFIATRGVPGATPLDVWLDRRAEDSGGRTPVLFQQASQRDRVIRLSAALVSRMHGASFFHVDMQLRNLLLVESAADDPVLYVLDSSRGGVRRWSVSRAYWRVRDLSSLYKGARGRVTRVEMWRWFCRYLGVRRPDWLHREMVRTIAVDRRLKDNGQTG